MLEICFEAVAVAGLGWREGIGWSFFHIGLLGTLGILFTVAAVHLAVMPRLRPVRWNAGEAPLVSILIPARNEALNIEACVRSLMAQSYPRFRVCVLDDHSTDETARIVESLGLNESNGGLIRGAELPPGWVGKNWACHQLSRAADGEYLLFTDADTVHSPDCVGALVAAARERGAVLVSAWPKQITVTLGEKLVVSLLPLVGTLFYPHFVLYGLDLFPSLRSRVPAGFRRLLGAANGQVMFFKREGYLEIGGHEAVRDHLVEDIALGRAVANRMHMGDWWVNCDAAGLVRCRMYRSMGEVWEGFSKNTRAAFEKAGVLFWAAGLWQFAVFVGPFVTVGVAGQGWPSALEIAGILILRSVVTVGAGGSWWSVVLHPLAYVLALSIGFNSWLRSGGPGVRWKGRLYSVRLDFSSKGSGESA